ncbi:MAG TPA: HD domain-containing protein [Herpetosiphonaceae bacterium]|nr:HD domain-containing protein [Herpetosiphonaceae bacterium]
MSAWSPDSFAQAWNFATFYHQGQTYGGPTEGTQIEYLNHVGSVAAEVIWALPERPDLRADLAIQCALLHDVVEDTRATIALVRETFGAAVADGVRALTKDTSLPGKAAQMADSLARIQAQGHEVWLVKLADRITNLYHPPFYWDNARIEEYRREAMAIHAALHPASPALAARLEAKIDHYRQFLRPE